MNFYLSSSVGDVAYIRLLFTPSRAIMICVSCGDLLLHKLVFLAVDVGCTCTANHNQNDRYQ